MNRPFLYSIALHFILFALWVGILWPHKVLDLEPKTLFESRAPIHVGLGPHAQRTLLVVPVIKTKQLTHDSDSIVNGEQIRTQPKVELGKHSQEGMHVSLPTSPSDVQRVQAERYFSQVRQAIEGQLEYPIALQRRGIEGRVKLRLVIGKSGELIEVSSISQMETPTQLIELALSAAHKAAPFPFLEPSQAANQPLILALAIDFQARHR